VLTNLRMASDRFPEAASGRTHDLNKNLHAHPLSEGRRYAGSEI
jgi:hypothetical protein